MKDELDKLSSEQMRLFAQNIKEAQKFIADSKAFLEQAAKQEQELQRVRLANLKTFEDRYSQSLNSFIAIQTNLTSGMADAGRVAENISNSLSDAAEAVETITSSSGSNNGGSGGSGGKGGSGSPPNNDTPASNDKTSDTARDALKGNNVPDDPEERADFIDRIAAKAWAALGAKATDAERNKAEKDLLADLNKDVNGLITEITNLRSLRKSRKPRPYRERLHTRTTLPLWHRISLDIRRVLV